MSYVALCPYVEPLFAVSVFRPYSWMCVCMYVAPYFNRTFVGIASVRFFRGGGPLFAVAATFTGAFLMDVVGFPQEVILGCVDVCPSIFQ